MQTVYGILAVLSFALLIIGIVMDRRRDGLMCLMMGAVCCAELGFFLISISRTLSAALWANRLCYLGQVFLPYFLMIMIAKLSDIRLPRRLTRLLPLIGLVVLAITMTPGLLPWYYSSVDIRIDWGVTYIVREYGPMHLLYYVYLFGYVTADTVILAFAIRGEKMRLPQQAWLLVGAVYIQVTIWLVEQFLPRGFEYLSISYVLAELFILLVNSMLRTLSRLHLDELEAAMGQLQTARSELDSLRAEVEAKREEPALQIPDGQSLADRLDALAKEYSLTERERQVLSLLLEGKSREEAAAELYLSEATIKKYISGIYRKMDVHNRSELFLRVSRQ